ncbi:hypothetical protein ACFL02_09940, partial [Planctomycetota bacterium]
VVYGRAKPASRIKQMWTTVLNGPRSRIEYRTEFYNREDSKEPDRLIHRIKVFDGTRQLNLEDYRKGWTRLRKEVRLNITDGNSGTLIKQLFGGDVTLIHNREDLKKYDELSLTKSDTPGVYLLEAIDKPSKLYYRFTIDGNRGYHITKSEWLRLSDGKKYHEDNLKLKQYPNGVWYVSERENILFEMKDQTQHTLFEKVTVTKVQFNTPTPKENLFKLSFPEGASAWCSLFYSDSPTFSFRIGCLSQPQHTQEAADVTAILDRTVVEKKDIWGPVREITINSIVERQNCLIDFESGKLFSLPADFHTLSDKAVEKWWKENGVDGRVETHEGLGGLWGFNTVVIPVNNERFDTIKPAACHKVLSDIEGVYPPIMSAEGKLPATYLFQTWDGRGILQILSINKDKHPHSIKLRYKMIQEKSSYPN